MYLISHFSASLDVYFFSVKRTETRSVENYHFIIVQKGSVSVQNGREQSVLSQGDILLLEPGCTYQLKCIADNFILNIELGKSFIGQLLPPNGRFVCNSAVGRKNNYRELSEILTELAMNFSSEDNQELLLSILFRLSVILKRNHIEAASPDPASSRRTGEIQAYIQHNYYMPLSLQDLADQMYLSPQYLSKFIRQHMGTTFTRYLNTVRIGHACEELLNTEHSITEIAFNHGFSSTASFNKYFKESYGSSPTAYRLEKRSSSDESLKDKTVPSKMHGLTDHLNAKIPEKAAIRLLAGQSAPYYANWNDTINIGTLTNALSHRFYASFEKIQRQIGFRYVRFDDIFSEEMMRPLDSQKGFDYTNLNVALDFFQRLHVLPFIELSYKPHKSHFIRHHDHIREYSRDDRREMEYYYKALDDLIRHCINRYGHPNVSQWRFEIWREHDGEFQYKNTAKEYADSFCRFREVVKYFLPDCQVGGPGFNTSADIGALTETLEELKWRKVCPDFVSVYIYCYSAEKYILKGASEKTLPVLSADPDFFSESYRSCVQTIQNVMSKDCRIYITEFNSGLSEKNYVAASCFQAAFICKNVLSLLSETSCMAYWHFSDELRQFSHYPLLYSTDTGLIDSHGLPKAPLFAYIMLSRLQGRLIACGKNYIAATNGTNSYQFLAFHYAHYNQNYCMNSMIPLNISHTYDVFEKSAVKSMDICFAELPAGRYKVIKYTLNRKHGSLLDEYIRIFDKGFHTPEELNYMILNMHQSEVDYYFHIIRPKLETFYMETDPDDSLFFSVTLEPHEVVLFELLRKQ